VDTYHNRLAELNFDRSPHGYAVGTRNGYRRTYGDSTARYFANFYTYRDSDDPFRKHIYLCGKRRCTRSAT
jgi:hypothetical protein